MPPSCDRSRTTPTWPRRDPGDPRRPPAPGCARRRSLARARRGTRSARTRDHQPVPVSTLQERGVGPRRRPSNGGPWARTFSHCRTASRSSRSGRSPHAWPRSLSRIESRRSVRNVWRRRNISVPRCTSGVGTMAPAFEQPWSISGSTTGQSPADRPCRARWISSAWESNSIRSDHPQRVFPDACTEREPTAQSLSWTALR